MNNTHTTKQAILLSTFIISALLISIAVLSYNISSDNSYTSPTIGTGYKNAQSDNTYTSPTSDNTYAAPTSDQNYRSPTSDGNYSSPTIGAGLERATNNQSVLKNQTIPPINQTNQNITKNITKAITGEKNQTINHTKNIINRTTSNNTTDNKKSPQGPIDKKSVGGWRPYSMTAYFTDGGSKFLSPSSDVMNLHDDGSWDYGSAEGTWEVAPVTEEDGNNWGIPITAFKKKIIFHNWPNGSQRTAEGPIEDTSYGARYLWAIYPAEQPEVTAPAQVWIRFSASIYTPKKEPSFSELSLIGKWRSNNIGPGESTQILELKADKTWNYSVSHGTWSVQPLEKTDWKKWGIDSYGPTKKIVLRGWRTDVGEKNVADGPIEIDKGQVIFVSVYYGIRSEVLQGTPLYGGIKFRPHPTTTMFLTTDVIGSGSITSQDKKIKCGNECAAEYPADTTITLSANPDQGWILSTWQGACQGSENTCTITLDHSKTATAEFTLGCTDDAACSAEESCEQSRCVSIPCSCGRIVNRECVPYTCCSEDQCGQGQTCNQEIHSCVATSACQPLLINGDPEEKHDIVFVGAGFTNASILERGIRLLMDFDGISESKLGVFSLTPFKENNKKFNAWLVMAPEYPHYAEESPIQGIGIDTLAVPDDTYYQELVNTCERDTVIIMSPGIFRPWARFPTSGASGGIVFMSLNNPLRGPEYLGRTLAHEIGHAIGGLADEYVEYGGADRTETEEFPNCAPDLATAEQKWGDILGIRDVGYYTGVDGISGTTYYKHPIPSFPELGFFPDGSDWGDGGCSYVHKNIRPTVSSIMGSHYTLDNDFGPVNERVLAEKLAGYPTDTEQSRNHNLEALGIRGRRFIEDAG